jgi:hypothetical protein
MSNFDFADSASPVTVTQAPVISPLMKQLSFPNGYEPLAHNRAREQALEKRAFRRSGGSATGVSLPFTNDAFCHAGLHLEIFIYLLDVPVPANGREGRVVVFYWEMFGRRGGRSFVPYHHSALEV